MEEVRRSGQHRGKRFGFTSTVEKGGTLMKKKKPDKESPDK